MKRRLLNFVTVLSLVLSTSVAALWVRSQWVADRIELGTADRSHRRYSEYTADSTQGNLVVTCRTRSFEQADAFEMYMSDFKTGPTYTNQRAYSPETWIGWPSVWNDLGFRGHRDRDTRTVARFRQNPRSVELLGRMAEEEMTVFFPHWFVWLVLVAAGWPAVRRSVRFAARRRPRSPGRCPRCGYDVRATPERCPECGAEPLRDSAESR